ncbi:MAG TPA: S9 family peptidase, partial [Pyrinomonadaceae bacterium]|nr:S9 family peptidase [Pyrinomonadaceae bacterium]
MKRFVAVLAVLLIGLCSLAFSQTRSYTVDDLLKVRRVGDPQLSPDGRHVAFTIGDVNVADNRSVNQIYVTTTSAGGELKRLTDGKSSSSAPRWSPDGKKLAFTTGGQIWIMDGDDGGDKKQITKISSGAAAPVWSPDGKWLAFTSDVYPDCKDDECNKKRDEQAESSKVKAHITTRLLYKHWDEWRDLKRTHVFVVSSNGGTARELTPGDFDSPPYAAASGVDYAFSPDSSEIAFIRNPDKVEAISTNSDIYVMPLAGGASKNITARNRGYDASPIYTRDGKFIIYRSQAAAGFEADRWRLMAYNRATGASVELTRGFDQQVDDVVLSPDGNHIYFTAGERGKHPIYRVASGGGTAEKVLPNVFASNIDITPDGKKLVFLSSSMIAAPEVFTVNADGSGVTALTSVNKALLGPENLIAAEDVEWTGALGKKVHGFIVKPAGFDPSKKYPLLVLIHGGPQSAWYDNWSYRWNPQVFANAGYVVFAPNPRGSVGYGQQFVNEISGDWGGKVMGDIDAVVNAVAKMPFTDSQRMGIAGASFGGYAVNWILGHTNRFKAAVTHDGVFNLESMSLATEELWFTDWEFGGPPWTPKARAQFAKWSPHLFANNIRTPTLIITNERDYRVPVDQGLQMFT